MFIHIISGILIVFAISCCPLRNCTYNSIPVVNKSNQALYCYFSCVTDSLIDTLTYGVDPKPSGLATCNNVNYYYIHPNSTNDDCISIFLSCIDEAFDKSNPNMGIEVFIFDSAVVYSSPTAWDTVKAKCLYLKRIVVNFHMIDSLGWRIYYPLYII